MKDNQYELNKGLAQMLKCGVIMDVSTPGNEIFCLVMWKIKNYLLSQKLFSKVRRIKRKNLIE